LLHDVPLGWGINADTTFRGHRPLKFWRAKTVQNSVRCRKTFEFDRKYFWNA